MSTQTMTPIELREALAPLEISTQADFVSGETEFVLDESAQRVRLAMTLPESTQRQAFELSLSAYVHMGKMLGIPEAYLDRTPPELMLPHLNYWLAASGRSYVAGMMPSGDTLQVAYVADRRRESVSGLRILDAIEAHLDGAPWEPHYVTVAPGWSKFSITSPARSGEVRVGDVIQGGVSVSYAYDLSRPLVISSYLHRLICTNGAISTDLTWRTTRSGDADDGWLSEVIPQAFESLDVQLGRLRELEQTPLTEHIGESLESVYTEFGVPATVREMVTRQLLTIAEPTAYDLFNAVTYVASNEPDVQLNDRLSSRLMSIGGQVAAHHQFCGECHRVLL